MRVGFTGTRKGMNEAQFEQLRAVLRWLKSAHEADARFWRAAEVAIPEFHHGASPAGGADLEASDEAVSFNYEAIPHPPEDRTAAAMLARNREIVDTCDVLIAAPESDREVQRSGTWMTIRYAQKQGIPVIQLSRGRR